jgi:hypothetical protein
MAPETTPTPDTAGASNRSTAYVRAMTLPTVVAEIEALRRRGYTADFAVTRDGQLRCDGCGHTHRPEDARIESMARFEGPSNPDDQAIVFGLRCEVCGLRGVLVTAYGPTATAGEASVVTALSPPQP